MNKSYAELLLESGLLLAVAESCTGGLLSSQITDIPGSSDYFVGGIVAYSNPVKEQLLGVDRGILETVGAVSKEVALEMAKGVCKRLNADIGIGTTGIAGPSGNVPGKPIGLVYIGLSAKNINWCERYVWDGDRVQNKERSVKAAFDLLEKYLNGKFSK